jgi:ribose transport system permease protein
MRKVLGLLILILALSSVTFLWEQYHLGENRFLTMGNWRNLLNWIGLFGILSLGQSLVIITGGIDLSVGSVVALTGIVAGLLLDKGEGWSPLLVLPFCLLLAGGIGGVHGVLVTKARMQPFVVTLCGLFVYRGVARFIAQDSTQGFGNAYDSMKWFGRGTLLDWFPAWSSMPAPSLPMPAAILNMAAAPFLVMLFIAGLLAAFLHYSAKGRHLFALGANEEAARFSGVRTVSLKIQAYILCSLICGLGGLLIAFKVNSMGPSDFGSFYELYAIAGAVLGGCSLRGGTGNVLGVILGISLIMILRNLVNILGVPSELEYVVIGGTILLGVFIDELFTSRASRAVT